MAEFSTFPVLFSPTPKPFSPRPQPFSPVPAPFVAPPMDTNVETLIAAMMVKPPGWLTSLYQEFIAGMKGDGNWTVMDVLCLLPVHDSQAALLNVKNPATFIPTLVGTAAPTFTAFDGIQTDGVDNYINTNFNPATAGGNHVRDSASWGIYSLTSGGIASGNNGQFDGTDGCFINPRDGSNNFIWTVNNSGATSTAGSTDGIGLFYANRSTSTVRQGGKNGVQLSNITGSTSSAVNSLTFKLGTHNLTNFNARKWGGYYIGPTRTEAQHRAIYQRFQAFVEGARAA